MDQVRLVDQAVVAQKVVVLAQQELPVKVTLAVTQVVVAGLVQQVLQAVPAGLAHNGLTVTTMRAAVVDVIRGLVVRYTLAV
jgi:hypothetical protein